MGTVGLSFGSLSSGTGFDVASTVTSILAISGAVETPWKTQLTSLKAQDTVLSTHRHRSLDPFHLAQCPHQPSTESSTPSSAPAPTPASSPSPPPAPPRPLEATPSSSSPSPLPPPDYSDRITNASDTLSGSLQIQVGSGTAQTITLGSTDTLSLPRRNHQRRQLRRHCLRRHRYPRLPPLARQPDLRSRRPDHPHLQPHRHHELEHRRKLHPGPGRSRRQPHRRRTRHHQRLQHRHRTPFLASPSSFSTYLPQALTPTAIQPPPPSRSRSPTTTPASRPPSRPSSPPTTPSSPTSPRRRPTTPAATAEPLFGSTTISTLQTQLSQAIFGGSAVGTGSSAISSITQLGLSVGTDGKLTLTTSSLDSALNNNFSNVLGFLQNSGTASARIFTTVLSSLGSYLLHRRPLPRQAAEHASQEATLNSNISNEETLLAAQKTTLTAELNAANQILQSLPYAAPGGRRSLLRRDRLQHWQQLT